MIVIDKVLISDEVVEEAFVCDLSKCKGGCCEDGDAGAPLTAEELDMVRDSYEKVIPYLTQEGREEVERQGLYRYDKHFGWVTPTVKQGICAYGYRDTKGIIKCAFEQAYNDGKIHWKKPLSCHLYPIRIRKSSITEHEMVNYEPRETLCSPGCSLGEKLKVPVYVFLRESIVRKYGEDFFNVLDQIAKQHYTNASKKPE
jgi:hypothetical protein